MPVTVAPESLCQPSWEGILAGKRQHRAEEQLVAGFGVGCIRPGLGIPQPFRGRLRRKLDYAVRVMPR